MASMESIPMKDFIQELLHPTKFMAKWGFSHSPKGIGLLVSALEAVGAPVYANPGTGQKIFDSPEGVASAYLFEEVDIAAFVKGLSPNERIAFRAEIERQSSEKKEGEWQVDQ